MPEHLTPDDDLNAILPLKAHDEVEEQPKEEVHSEKIPVLNRPPDLIETYDGFTLQHGPLSDRIYVMHMFVTYSFLC